MLMKSSRFDTQQKKRAKLVSNLDVNHSHFVVCEKRGNASSGDAQSVFAQSSPTIDVAERITAAVLECKRDMLRTRVARRMHVEPPRKHADHLPGLSLDGHSNDPTSGVSAEAANALNAECDASKVCLVINGGSRAKLDVLNAVRGGWDVVVVKGTGGLADWIAINWQVARVKVAQATRRRELRQAAAAEKGEEDPGSPRRGSAADMAADEGWNRMR